MNNFYIIAAILLILSAVFARREYFVANPTNINIDSVSRFLAGIAILKPVDASGNDISGNDISGNDISTQNPQLVKDIRSAVRDEIIATNLASSNTAKAATGASCNQPTILTPSLQQGQQFSNPATYDMNQYIRKDSIPCHACTLDY